MIAAAGVGDVAGRNLPDDRQNVLSTETGGGAVSDRRISLWVFLAELRGNQKWPTT
jgi:hypothetical protein